MVTIAIGVAAFVFGVYTIYLRLTHPDKLGKLALMKEKFGEKPGNLIHLVGFQFSDVPVYRKRFHFLI
jgi:hypothetical protein